MTLNKSQFGEFIEVEAPHRSWSRDSTFELAHEQEWQHRNIVRGYRKYNPKMREWPRYEGMGSSLMAHEGIVVRGYQRDQEAAETEMARRGMPKPERGLHTLRADIDDPEYSTEYR